MFEPLLVPTPEEWDYRFVHQQWMSTTKKIRQHFGLEGTISERWNSWNERRGQFQSLAGVYAKPSRRYHTLQHIAEGLADLQQVREIIENPLALTLAWIYHDGVYNTLRHDNEEQSAVLLERDCAVLHFPDSFIKYAKDLVLLTEHFRSPPLSLSIDQQIMLDTDLAILGSSPTRFRQYCDDIQREYHWVVEQFGVELYCQRRIKVLESFVERSSLYHTPFFQEKYQLQAKENLQREIERLNLK